MRKLTIFFFLPSCKIAYSQTNVMFGRYERKSSEILHNLSVHYTVNSCDRPRTLTVNSYDRSNSLTGQRLTVNSYMLIH